MEFGSRLILHPKNYSCLPAGREDKPWVVYFEQMRRLLPKVIYKDQFEQIFFTFREIAKLLWKINPRFTLFLFVLSGLWGLLTFPTFYLEKLILDRLVANIGNPNLESVVYPISFLVLVRVTLEVTRNIMSSFLGFLREHASKNFHIEIELMLADKLSRLDVATIEDPDFQDRYNKIEREAGRRAWGMMMPLTDIPNYVIGFISTIGILWFLHPLIALGVILISLPAIIVDRKFIKKWYDFELETAPLHRIRGHVSHYLIRSRNYLELRILKLREYLISKMRLVHYDIVGRELVLSRQKEYAGILTQIPALLFYAVANVYLVLRVVSAKITIGSYELFLRALLAASQNFAGLTSSLLAIYENYVFVRDLIWFLNLESKIKETGGKKLGKIARGIEIKDVWFKYKLDGKWILKGINANFPVGEKIAIVGENGAGKSTLIKVLGRFYDVSRGEVTVDGVNVKDINYPAYHDKFAVLFQDFDDYSFTARESIGYGDINRVNQISEIRAAAAKTGMDEYIDSLPLKYETPLSPHFFKGVQLSGGQWQRVGIARVLFRKKAEVLILDEPTSNVDPEAEEKIFNELLKISKEKTIIFVSQRFSTVRRADRILVVDQGKIIEQGGHVELMKKKGKYARLFTLQAQGYK